MRPAFGAEAAAPGGKPFPRPAPGLARPAALGWLVVLGASLVVISGCGGCGGCRRDPAQALKEQQEEEAKKRAEQAKPKPKPDFERVQLRTRPHEPGSAAKDQSPLEPVKPGHFTSVTMAAKANNFNFLGEMELVPADPTGDTLPLRAAPFELATTRQVALSKGAWKLFETSFYVPVNSRALQVAWRLKASRGGSVAVQSTRGLLQMPSYQYHWVVLARWPDRYKYLESLPAVSPPGSFDTGAKPYYHVVLLGSSSKPPLPSHFQYWTSTACVLWDDADPLQLSPEQQQALLDWLHWGGHLILSGPDTLDTLRDSFLGDYLPALAAGAREIGQDDVAQLNSVFASASGRALVLARPLNGVQLELKPEARFVPDTGGLIAERRVGRGWVVVTAFVPAGRDLTSWPGWDAVVNACLLRRPPRRYGPAPMGGICLNWAPADLNRLDAGLVSKFRVFTRDCGVRLNTYVDPEDREEMPGYGPDVAQIDSGEMLARLAAAPGVGAWNDFNQPASRARAALAEAARIEIPPRDFVVWVLGTYLVVLVPLNWLTFRLIGRVEWAWGAAPLIALVCMVAVVRLAQLDIGFVRSQSEIGVLETQGSYGRAHLTRYNAFYTSLATGYEFRFDDRGAVMQPFPEVRSPNEYRLAFGTRMRSLRRFCGPEVDVSGFAVGSNLVRMVHSEEMCELGGAWQLSRQPEGAWQLSNGTKWTVQGAGLLRKETGGRHWAAWLGTVRAGQTAPVVWQALDPTHKGVPWTDRREAEPLTCSSPAEGELCIRGLIDLAEDFDDLQPGEVRLVGWTDQRLPGMKIDPPAPQARYAVVVVAHLGYGFGADPQPDANYRAPEPGDAAWTSPATPHGPAERAEPNVPSGIEEAIGTALNEQAGQRRTIGRVAGALGEAKPQGRSPFASPQGISAARDRNCGRY